MIQEEILEGNKLIAEFIGYILYKPIRRGLFGKKEMTWYYGKKKYWSPLFFIQHFQFHKDWNWLMTAIGYCLDKNEENLDDWEHYYEAIDDSLFQVEIIPTWKEVVKFIKWYNTQEK